MKTINIIKATKIKTIAIVSAVVLFVYNIMYYQQLKHYFSWQNIQVKSSQLYFRHKNLHPLKEIPFSITEINIEIKNNCNSSNQKRAKVFSIFNVRV